MESNICFCHENWNANLETSKCRFTWYLRKYFVHRCHNSEFVVKRNIVDDDVWVVVMTGGEKMQDSGTQSETPQVNTGYCQFADTHQVSILIRFVGRFIYLQSLLRWCKVLIRHKFLKFLSKVHFIILPLHGMRRGWDIRR